MNVPISPKVLLPAVLQLVAGVVLWLATGNNEYLVLIATGIVGGGVGFTAPVVDSVNVRDVVRARHPVHWVPGGPPTE